MQKLTAAISCPEKNRDLYCNYSCKNLMLRYLFAILLFLHGLIHLMGFAKAFNYGEIAQLTASISRPAGLLWLLAAVLLIMAAALFLLHKDWWWLMAIGGVLISQVLILTAWSDARFGTIANVIILVVASIAEADRNFQRSIKQQEAALLEQSPALKAEIITPEMLQNLPAPVQRWLTNSGIVGREKIYRVHLKQKGQMRLKPEQENWTEAHAEQYITTEDPAYIWKVRMDMNPLLPAAGRDAFRNGKGQMLIKLFSLAPIVNQADEKIDQGALQRYLAEICWYPSAALSPYITWEAMDEHTAKATMTYQGTTGAVTFRFNAQGDLLSCTADRYQGGGAEARLQQWEVKCTEWGPKNGIRIPVKSEATWKLPTGDFTWYKLEITDIEYNQPYRK